MINFLNVAEAKRLDVQNLLDKGKKPEDRNRMGQFATPPKLADQILLKAKEAFRKKAVSFLDPAIGTGVFYVSTVKTFGLKNIEKAVGFEIDSNYGKAASKIWKDWGLSVKLEDFTFAEPPAEENKKFDLIVCNPPYVRHHLIPKKTKERLRKKINAIAETKISQLMGLYGMFLLISTPWMKQSGIGCWLVPGEFLDVNYGQFLKKFLLKKVRLIQIHRFDPSKVQFDNALVSSTVILFENKPPERNHSIDFSFGSSLLRPQIVNIENGESLNPGDKWNKLFSSRKKPILNNKKNLVRFGDIFNVKRGIATGANEFFILSLKKIQESKVSERFLKPILPSPRILKDTVINSDSKGCPEIDNPLYLLDVNASTDELKRDYPDTHQYLQIGKKKGIDKRYLCKKRKLWYMQEKRDPAPIMVTYMARRKVAGGRSMFRFILNKSNAIGANTYLLLYPTSKLKTLVEKKQDLIKVLWKYLNECSNDIFISGGRVYGGGLHKMEPKELANLELCIRHLLQIGI